MDHPAFSLPSSSSAALLNCTLDPSSHCLLRTLPVLEVLVKRANERIVPNERETYSIVAVVIFFVFGFVFWHLPIARELIAAHKLFVTGWHELCHLGVGIACGGKVESICIDPNVGGRIQFSLLLRQTPRPSAVRALEGGIAPERVTQLYWSGKAVISLSAGYVGSELLGGVFILCGFDIVASKIASFFIGIGLLVPVVRATSWLPIASIVLTEGLMIGLWFGAHGEALRYFVLFTGTLHLFFVVWDVTDERFFGKINSSDASEFEELIGGSATLWTSYFFLLAVLTLAASVIGGIAIFKADPDDYWKRASRFLPT